MAKFLYENGINSISVNADAAYIVSKIISDLENGNGSEEVKIENASKINNQMSIVEEKEQTIVERNFDNSGEAKSEKPEKEEDLILQALGTEGDENEEIPGEYSPSLGEKRDDVPNLNESIPVNSQHLESSEKKEQDYFFDTKKEENLEKVETFENQSEKVFDNEIKKEVEENMPSKEEFGPKDEVKSESKNLMKDEFLDIF